MATQSHLERIEAELKPLSPHDRLVVIRLLLGRAEVAAQEAEFDLIEAQTGKRPQLSAYKTPATLPQAPQPSRGN